MEEYIGDTWIRFYGIAPYQEIENDECFEYDFNSRIEHDEHRPTSSQRHLIQKEYPKQTGKPLNRFSFS